MELRKAAERRLRRCCSAYPKALRVCLHWSCGRRRNGACGAAAQITQGAAGTPGEALQSGAARRLRRCCRAHPKALPACLHLELRKAAERRLRRCCRPYPKALRGCLHWSFGRRRNGACGAAAQITQGAAVPPGEALLSAAARRLRLCFRAHPHALPGCLHLELRKPAERRLRRCCADHPRAPRSRLEKPCGALLHGACGAAAGRTQMHCRHACIWSCRRRRNGVCGTASGLTQRHCGDACIGASAGGTAPAALLHRSPKAPRGRLEKRCGARLHGSRGAA